jgi:hypothetical protein
MTEESFDSLTYISHLLEELAAVPNVTAMTEGKA